MPAPSRLARAPLAAAVCAAALAAASCHVPPLSLFFGGETHLDVTVSPQLNGNAPVAVDVIFVYDKSIYQQLLKMSASAWFAQRDQFLRDHSTGRKEIESQMWQWVPGQTVAELPLAYKVGARGGIVFASYATSGDHRQTFDPAQNLRLALNAQDFSLTQSS